MLSIQPKWCELIVNGKKTIEIRKTKPKFRPPFKCYIYETGGKKYGLHRPFGQPFGYEGCQMIIGEFVCDEIKNIFSLSRFWGLEDVETQSCLKAEQIREYANGREKCYSWHISDLKIYAKPKELSDFNKVLATDSEGFIKCGYEVCPFLNQDGTGKHSCKNCTEYMELSTIKTPPQSWCYVENI